MSDASERAIALRKAAGITKKQALWLCEELGISWTLIDDLRNFRPDPGDAEDASNALATLLEAGGVDR